MRRWQDDSPDSWEFEDNLAPQLIADFEATEEGQRSLKLEEYQEGGYGQAGLPGVGDGGFGIAGMTHIPPPTHTHPRTHQ